jgi:hypothetical protein
MFSDKTLKRIAQHMEFSESDFGQGSNEPIELSYETSDTPSQEQVQESGGSDELSSRLEQVENWISEMLETSDAVEDRLVLIEEWVNYLASSKELDSDEVASLRDQVQFLAKHFSELTSPEGPGTSFGGKGPSEMTDEEFYKNYLGENDPFIPSTQETPVNKSKKKNPSEMTDEDFFKYYGV